MGSKYKEAFKAGLATLMIPVAKMILDVILDKLSNRQDIRSIYGQKGRDYNAQRR
ncbi:MAG: hypothetical protein HQK61_09740 [Desulfamplus sp.]|nr:hypothetical protein [Desulfamplus sp.]